MVDGFAYERCTVGGDDATDAVLDLIERIDRPDVSIVLLAGVAPAWFNVLDLPRLHEATGFPILSISFEASDGLAPAIRDQFDGAARDWRLDVYESLPPRRSLTVNDEQVFVRAVGIDAPSAEGAVNAADTANDDTPDAAANDDADADDTDTPDAPDVTLDATTDPAPPLAPNCEAAQVVRGFTPEGGRPEPLRVARLAARAGRELGDRLAE